MALGNNLKKQKLIPETDQKKSAKQKVSSKPLTKSIKSKSTKKTINKKSVPKKIDDSAVYISAEALKSKQALRTKFNLEIDLLQDKKIPLVVFKLANDLYAIEMNYVKEVVATPDISKVPNAPKHILGVADIRGTILPIIDLSFKYDLKGTGLESNENYTMVLSSNFGSVGFRTNEVPFTLTCEGNQIKKITELMSESILNENFVKGIIKMKNQMVMLIDVDEMIEDEKLKVKTA
jgi:purine-binding chemotaxis protein CheW